MAENYIKPEDVSPEDAQKVLSFLNSAKSAEEIARTVEIPEERDVGTTVAQHLLDKREELGGFTDLKQVATVVAVGPERFTEIVTTLRGITVMEELFTLTPLCPIVNTQHLKASGAPCVEAYMYTFGGVTSNRSPYRLDEQYGNDEIIIGSDAVPLSNEVLPWDCQKNCGIQVLFKAFNVGKHNHYHLVFIFRGIVREPTAQIFVDQKLQGTVKLVGDKPEQHPIVISCEGKIGVLVDVWVRLASNDWAATMGFKGVDCFVV